MRYEQDRNASGEILRLLIQKMAAHSAAFNPHTYTVWYEFITGMNPALNAALSKMIEGGNTVDDKAIEKLYAKNIALGTGEEQRETINLLLNKIAEYTAETDRQAHQFGDNLQVYGDKLKQMPDAGKLDTLINTMVGDTSKMRGSMQTLKSELEASKQEVEKLHQELKSARGEALIDPLTGIHNRRGFETIAKQIFEDKNALEKGVCILMLDIDHFKKVNDTYGHLFGDKIIRVIAETVKSKIRGQDSVARMGGEEFAIVLTETNTEGAKIVAEHIRQSIEGGKVRRLDTKEHITGITVSLGMAVYENGKSIVDLLDQADKALYISKNEGRNRTTVFAKA
jgi:diguanylate cyclase